MYSPCGFAMKSPVTVSRAPYASSAEEQVKLSLGTVRMPRNTYGSSSSQLAVVNHA